MADLKLYTSSDLSTFFSQILHCYNKETLSLVKAFIRSKAGVSREDIKKLAEAGDWKAALVLGLTYDFRFVCEKDECELAIRPPFEKSRPFSHRKAIKYYSMAAEHDSVEAFAGLGRVLTGQMDQNRALKDYFFKSSTFESSRMFRNVLTFSELTNVINYIKTNYKMGEQLLVPIPGITGVMLFRLNLVGNSRSPFLKEMLSIPLLKKAYSLLKSCRPAPMIACISNQFLLQKIKIVRRSVNNTLFIQKADIDDKDDPTMVGVRMDFAALFDADYFNRMNVDQPRYHCEHEVDSFGNSCDKCDQLAIERISSVYENTYHVSKEESIIGSYYSVIFPQQTDLKKHDNFNNYGKFEIITAIRVLALQPMDLHPLQLAKDPNIYWNIVHYYGSVYSALKEILEPKTVKSIFENIHDCSALPKRRNELVDKEKFALKCGNSSCLLLDWRFVFKPCSRCLLRRYCSSSCQKLDWNLHKKECFVRPGVHKEK